MTVCMDYRLQIQLYLDHELSSEDQNEFLAHVETCATCRQELNEAKELVDSVRRARPQITAPAALRERVVQLAAEAERKQNNVLPVATMPRRKAPHRPQWRPMALAAALCVVVGLPLLLNWVHRQTGAEHFVATAIAARRAVMSSELPLDVRSDSPQVVSAWFAGRVPFAFRMPNAGIASETRAKYKLVGGRLMDFGGQHAALLVYQMPGDTITLLMASDQLAGTLGRDVRYSGGIALHSSNRDQMHIVTWDNQKVIYAMIYAHTAAQAGQCSNCHEEHNGSTAAALEYPAFR